MRDEDAAEQRVRGVAQGGGDVDCVPWGDACQVGLTGPRAAQAERICLQVGSLSAGLGHCGECWALVFVLCNRR